MWKEKPKANNREPRSSKPKTDHHHEYLCTTFLLNLGEQGPRQKQVVGDSEPVMVIPRTGIDEGNGSVQGSFWFPSDIFCPPRVEIWQTQICHRELGALLCSGTQRKLEA